jgi:hypothetical protein
VRLATDWQTAILRRTEVHAIRLVGAVTYKKGATITLG